jgi:hypothetical protein
MPRFFGLYLLMPSFELEFRKDWNSRMIQQHFNYRIAPSRVRYLHLAV